MKRRNPEQAIQKAVVEHLRLYGVPGLIVIPVPNGGWRSKVEAAIMKGWGVRAGVSDLLFFHDGKFYALELKAPKGVLSDPQKQFIRDVVGQKGRANCAWGLDEALNVLGSWGLLKIQRQAA